MNIKDESDVETTMFPRSLEIFLTGSAVTKSIEEFQDIKEMHEQILMPPMHRKLGEINDHELQMLYGVVHSFLPIAPYKTMVVGEEGFFYNVSLYHDRVQIGLIMHDSVSAHEEMLSSEPYLKKVVRLSQEEAVIRALQRWVMAQKISPRTPSIASGFHVKHRMDDEL